MRFGALLPKFLNKKKPSASQVSDAFSQKIAALTGFVPKDISAFREAFTLRTSDVQYSYERLEFLGDAVLGSIISEEIFHLYPDRDEGFLTQLKSKIVNRKTLNSLGERLGLPQLIINMRSGSVSPDIAGNLIESLVGAIYLSNGYEECKNFIKTKLFTQEDIRRMEHVVVSYKSVLFEWSQSHQAKIELKTDKDTEHTSDNQYITEVWLNQKLYAKASDSSKKKSEEKACRRAFYSLNPKLKIQKNVFQHRG